MPATLTAPIPEPVVASPSLMTADEFWDFCQRSENQHVRHELESGKVISMSQPSMMHGWISVQISTELTLYSRMKGVGFAVDAVGVILERDPDTVRGPDVAFDPLVNGQRVIPRRWSISPPLIAVEVLSPNDRAQAVARKVSEYLAGGVGEVWVIDPEEKSIVVHAPGQRPVSFEPGLLLTSKLLPDFSIDLTALFDSARVGE
jgi:Uma2 family endonuclease